ncbi:MAG: hypothetical protein IPJ28_17905 [Betaproteobacteria bacterium]|nr:hypothetical protein [Betaproteobacteria bacterium]
MRAGSGALTGWPRVVLQDGVHQLEELAVALRRALGLALGTGFGREPAERHGVRRGVLGDEAFDAVRLGKHRLAPLLGTVEAGGLARGRRLERLELRHEGSGVQVAHELADELHLAPQRLVLGDRAGGLDGLAKPFGQLDLRELLGPQFRERDADGLQVVALPFALRFADKILVFHRLENRQGAACRGCVSRARQSVVVLASPR